MPAETSPARGAEALAAALQALDAADSLAALQAACAALRRIARHGSVDAALVVGRVLWALPAQAAEGVGWLAAAARTGNADAMHLLGLAFFRGQGVAQDLAAARRLQAAAAALGHVDAQVELTLLRDGAPAGYVDRRAASAPAAAFRDTRFSTLLVPPAASPQPTADLSPYDG